MNCYDKINAELFRKAELAATTCESQLWEIQRALWHAHAKAVAVQCYEDASRYAVNFYRDDNEETESGD